MARKPVPGSDEGKWGEILNAFLDVAHAEDGTLKDNSVVESKLAPGVRSKLNATGNGAPADGSINTAKLADGAVTNVKVAANAGIAQSKIANLTTDLAGKADTAHTHTLANVTGLQSALDGKAAASHTHPTPDLELADLTDVNTSGATSGQVLTWQGSQWAAADQTGGGGTGGVSDHGALSGLADDDHPQYLNNTRGDARYYTRAQADAALDGKANTAHSHSAAELSSGVLNTARLGTGTASASTVLYGDGTWKSAPSGGGGGVPDDGSVTNAKVATNANIAQSKIADLTSDLAAKANSNATVNLTGNQTVAGVKTFSAAPVVPTPTTNTQAANKAYVDSVAGGGGGMGVTAVQVSSSDTSESNPYQASVNQFIIATTASGRADIRLPAPTNGALVKVKKNSENTNGVLIWAPSGQEIHMGPGTSVTDTCNGFGQVNDYWADGDRWHRG